MLHVFFSFLLFPFHRGKSLREVRPKEIRTNSLCRLFLLLPSYFPFPAGEISPPTLLRLPVYSQRSCETASCLSGAFPTLQLSVSSPLCGEARSCCSPPPSRSILHAGEHFAAVPSALADPPASPPAGCGEWRCSVARPSRQPRAELGNGMGACTSSGCFLTVAVSCYLCCHSQWAVWGIAWFLNAAVLTKLGFISPVSPS